MKLRSLRSALYDKRGVSAVEFAIVVPVILAMIFGGFTAAQAIALNRKITITTRALADLTSQYGAMTMTDMATVMNAATQILAPFDGTPLGIRISEITTDATGLKAYVTWSAGSNTTCYPVGAPFTLPTGLRGSANVSYIYAETTYPYQPSFGSNVIGPITMGDNIYMLPRTSQTVNYSGSATCQPTS